MVFSSMIFLWIFLPVLLLLYFFIKDKYKNIVLLIFSLLFYAWGEPKYIILMLLSIVINYIFGLCIDKSQNDKKRKLILAVSIVCNLLLLGYFKYFNFFSMNLNRIFGDTVIKIKDIVLPIGISFYTFQIMSYVIDVYRKDINVQKNIFKLALYISFFPQLIAGPIVKYHDINEQLDARSINVDKFASGVKRFVLGLSKKVILANTLAVVADIAFDADYSMLSTGIAWIGAICYMLQIFFDFSGYSDMAIGLGRMFGFEFMENFNLPYISQSLTEFWRRWHISLSTWFKEYLYIPLGGNRKGRIRTYVNLFIVFLATGIWHGASWNFVFWGLYNGVILIIERIKFKQILDKNRFKVINHIYTLFVVLIGWVFFRANGIKRALMYLRVMFIPKSICKLDVVSIINVKNIITIILAILLCGVVQCIYEKFKNKKASIFRNIFEDVSIVVLLSICIMSLVSSTYNPFIYFRF